jgi:hypothetical protein
MCKEEIFNKDDSFLHENASRWQHWEPQLQALSNQFRCIAA